MNELTQLREHVDRRASAIESKVDDVLTAIRGDGIGIEGLAAKTAKNSHDVNGLKLVVPALGERMAQVEHKTAEFTNYMNERKDDNKWRKRAILGAIIAACGTTTVAQAWMAIKATFADKGTP